MAYAAKEVVLAAGETQIVEVPVVIEKPILWNGRKNAYIYEAKVSMISLMIPLMRFLFLSVLDILK